MPDTDLVSPAVIINDDEYNGASSSTTQEAIVTTPRSPGMIAPLATTRSGRVIKPTELYQHPHCADNN